MNPSKADRILSGYRPIAPKPPAFPSTDPSSTCVSASSGRYRRSRKRRTSPPKVPSLCTAPASRSSLSPGVEGEGGSSLIPDVAINSQNALSTSTGDGWAASSDVVDLHSEGGFSVDAGMNCFVGACDANRARCVLRSTVHSEQAQGDALRMAHDNLIRSQRRPRVLGIGAGPFEGIPHCSRVPEQQQRSSVPELGIGSCERAFAFQHLPEKATGCGSNNKIGGLGFTEMIRGITRLPSAADVQCLMQGKVASTSSTEISQNSCTYPASNDSHRGCHQVPGVSVLSSSWNAHNSIALSGTISKPLGPHWLKNLCSEHKYASKEAGIVTLPSAKSAPPVSEPSLLACTSTAAAMPGYSRSHMLGFETEHVELGLGCSRLEYAADAKGDRSMVPVECQRYPQADKVDSALVDGSIIDHAYLECTHGASTDPVLLLDESRTVLWSNHAYDRAFKFSSERFASKGVASGPYIDPLGNSTPLGIFGLRRSGRPILSKVTLWGFLKKIVVQEEEVSAQQEDGGVVSGCNITEVSNALSLCLGDNKTSSRKHTHRPHPFHSSSSSMTLDCITDIHLQATPMKESLVTVERRLSEGAPSFITDRVLRVTWVNSAFRTTLGCSDDSGSSNATFFGAVVVLSAENLPCPPSAFSGRMNLELVKMGRKRSVTMPCDVCPFTTSCTSTEMWVWRLDVSASLSLACRYMVEENHA